MDAIALGRTGLTVGRIGFGAIKLPLVDEDTAAEALHAALDSGITFVDTARNYRDSEAKIGRALAGRRAEFVLATKSSARDASGLRRDLETSLRELRTDRIDLYQLHSVSDGEEWRQVMGRGGALEAVRRAQSEGLVRHVGITIHRDHQVMRAAIASGEFETMMLCYSPIDTEGVGPEILPKVAASGMGLIVMKALSGGMLVSEGFEEGRRPAPDAEDPLVSGALRFVLSHPAVHVVIPGMRNVHEVRQNARLGEGIRPLSESERADLLRAIGRKRKAFRYGQVCLQCGYCQPCPQGVPIPHVLRSHMIVQSYPEPLRAAGIEAYRRLEVGPEACIECGRCVERCPAGLEIPVLLKQAKEALERA